MAISPAKLLKRAAGCSKAELLAIRGVGVGTVVEIEQWLDAHGYGFRSDPDALTTALGKAIEHLEAVVESHSDEALLQAFLALPALKKALRAAPWKQVHSRQVRALDRPEPRTAASRR